METLTAYAPTYAAEMEALGHEKLSRFTRAEDPAYLRMIDMEKRWLTTNRAVNDIYTYKRDPDGTLRLIVDSETDYDGNGNTRASASRARRSARSTRTKARRSPTRSRAASSSTRFPTPTSGARG